MAGLTSKREAFAAGLVKGLSQAEAYREAFPNSRRWKDQSVWDRASKLAANVEVRQRVSELREQLGERTLLTLEQHVAELARLRQKAESVEQFSAAIKAEELRGKACGLYVERTEVTGKGGGPVRLVW